MNTAHGPAPLPESFRRYAPDFSIPDAYDAPPLRWGILGAGGIARTFATDVPAYSNQVISAVGSRAQDRAEAFANELEIPHPYGSYEELVASDEVDVVYVATPHSRHRDDAILALEAGKPVLVEKAFTMTLAEAEEVFATAERKGLFAMEAMWSRHLPHYRYLAAVVESGLAGKPVAVHGDHGQDLQHVPRLMLPELGGGSLHDLGVYPLHFAHAILGRPDSVVSRARWGETGVINGEAVVGYHHGALSVSTSNLDGISATAGSVTFDDISVEMPELFYRPTEVIVRTFDNPADGFLGQTSAWDARVPGGFQYQAAEAARCIGAGLLESPVVPWSSTLDVMWVMDQVLDQAATDR